MTGIEVVTVSERPTRVIVAAMFLLGAGAYPAGAAVWVDVGTAAWLGGGATGLAQLLLAVHRRLG